MPLGIAIATGPGIGGGGGAAAPSIAAPSFAYQNTTFTNDESDDGTGWTNSRPITVDQYGKLIAIIQRHNSGTKLHTLCYSNDGGATWADSAISSGFLDRGSAVYDSANDLVHVLWNAAAATDGVIYRRYSISRGAANTITGFTQVAGVNLQIDFENAGTMAYQHPCILWLNDAGFGANGALLCVWSARNSAAATTKAEIRASLRVLSNTVADNTASNWAAPVSAATSLIGQSPQVPYSILQSGAGSIMWPSIGRKTTGTNAKDVYLCYHNGEAAGSGQWRFRRLRWNAGSSNWSTGLSTDTLITASQRAGSDTGYSLKYQLGTYVWEDTAHDRMVYGLATWKSNAAGDTWGLSLLDSADGVTLADAYSAGGVHSFAPTGDICYDATSDRIVAAWLTTTQEYVQAQLFSGATAQGSPQTIYNTVSPSGCDIPLLYPRLSGKLLVMFRDRVNQTPPSGSPRFRGLFGTLTWG